ncbi:MAG: hypothetical protein Q9167_000148 [Letrouitia subvulpina]
MILHSPQSFIRQTIPLARQCRFTQIRRHLATASPAQKSRSWKNTATRWALAGGAVYYYNNSNIFAEKNPLHLDALLPDSPTDDTSLPTLETISAARKNPPPPTDPPKPASGTSQSSPNAVVSPTTAAVQGSLDDTEEEASQQGAFNEETGEINWDCPCLGGMAFGPCGEQFRAAFSCFVFSKEDPKGMDCIENFKNMQDCFREHPDVYGGELEEDEALEREIEAEEQEKGGQIGTASRSMSATARERDADTSGEAPRGHVEQTEKYQSVPIAAHDATEANEGK